MCKMKQRYARSEAAIRYGLWGNTALALFKGIVGWLSGSTALLADAFRSTAEAAESYADLRLSRRARAGRAGRGGDMKAETAKNVVLSAIMLLAGMEIGISSIRVIIAGDMEAPHWPAAAAALFGLLVRQWVLPPGGAGDRRAALYVSAAAAAGAGGAWIGNLMSVPQLSYLDPAAGLIISALVLAEGCRLIVGTARSGAFAERGAERADELMQVIQRVEGVITVEMVRARERGHYVVVEVVISVNPRISVMEGSEIAKRVRLLLLDRFIHVADVTVHVEPYDPGYPYRSNHDPNQEHMPTLLQ